MKIEHLAIWVKNLEVMKAFYTQYFHVTSNEKYINQTKGFSSYFLNFESGARLELMNKHSLNELDGREYFGYAHLAIALGKKEAVDELTKQMEKDGHKVVGQPRTTGDGYYESVIEDPEGNLIELTV